MAWDRIHGHEALVRAFEQAWRRGRLAHAYLFVGPVGVGKRQFALELAKALLCEARPPGAPGPQDRLVACGQCPSCVLAGAGNHPDLYLLARPEDSNEIRIDPILELCQALRLTSAHARAKVAILDDADDLNSEAANCFLKTLEEPPPGSVFILLGTARQRQWPTVVSRCQVVPFAPLSDDVIAEVLRREGLAEPALLGRLVRLSEGSPGQAVALADPELWRVRLALVEGLAAEPPDTVGLARQFMQFVEEAGKELTAQRRRASLVLRLLSAALHDALRVSLGGPARSADSEESAALGKLAGRLTAEQLLGLIDRCLEADEHVGRYVQLVLVIEGLLDALGQIIRDRSAPVPV